MAAFKIFTYVTLILLQKPWKDTWMSVSPFIKTMGSRLLLNMTLCHWMSGSQRFKDLNAFKTLELQPYLQSVTWEKTWNFSTSSATTCGLSILSTVFVLLMSLNIVHTSCAELQPSSLGASGCTVLTVNIMLTKFSIIFQFTIIQISRILHSKSWVWLSLESLLFPTHNFWVEILIYYNVVIHCGGL